MPYTVTAVAGNPRQWNAAQGGPMLSYRVNLKDTAGVETQNVEWAKKATSKAPVVGETVEGNLDNTPHGLKLKVAFNATGNAGGGRPKDPAERAAIAASVALKWAISAAEQAATLGIDGSKPTTLEEHVALLKRYADYGFAFIDKKSRVA